MNNTDAYLPVDWPAPSNIAAIYTSRLGGVSHAPYDSFNLADHVGDAPARVEQNRQQLLNDHEIDEICWLNQLHGTQVITATAGSNRPDGDASWTQKRNLACAVLVADCLPVLVTNRSATKVGVAHAGWRGLSQGVIAKLIRSMDLDAEQALVWLGPAIGQAAFEVGRELLELFQQSRYFAGMDVQTAFQAGCADRLHADLYALARMQLSALGIQQVYGGDQCTYSQPKQFFSYRRDGVTGRMAALIWIKDPL